MEVKRWRHKVTKKEFNVVPWWDMQGSVVDNPKGIIEDENDTWTDRLYAVGVLAQIGWLIENEHNVWFGVGPGAKDEFEDITADSLAGDTPYKASINQTPLHP